MGPIVVYLLGLALALVLLVTIWIEQLRTRDASAVDAVWAASLGLMGILYAALGTAPAATRLLLALMAGIWAFRLAGYLALRMRGKPEDSRYAAARESWGRKADIYMLGFFLLQGAAAWVLSLPFLVLAYRPSNPALAWIVIGLLVWVVSVTGEALADRQLHRFKQDPANKGKVYSGGLWRYSRHPNYFFESLHWVSYVIIAIGAPYWWATLLSPVLMAVLLLKVSGIPTIEKKDASEKREGHDEYVRTTSAFIPWPPKKDT